MRQSKPAQLAFGRTKYKYTYLLGRPTYMSADLYFTRILLSSFFRQLISEVAERNSTKISHMLGSNCDLKTHVHIWGIPSPTNRGPKHHNLSRLRNLTATLTAYIFGMKHDINNRSSVLTTTRGLLHRAQCRELWSTNGFKLDLHFYPPYVNSAFYRATLC